jgi:hypothetical protein
VLTFFFLTLRCFRSILPPTAKKPDPLKPTNWNIYKFASKAVWLGIVEAAGESAAMEKGAAEYKVPANRLMAIRR